MKTPKQEGRVVRFEQCVNPQEREREHLRTLLRTYCQWKEHEEETDEVLYALIKLLQYEWDTSNQS